MAQQVHKKRYCFATVSGQKVRVVDPAHFYAGQSPNRGQGLFCHVDLQPGDIWWAHNFLDPRFVNRVIPWEEYKKLVGEEKSQAEILCYVNPEMRSLIICTEPFPRVNHGQGDAANSDSDNLLNSVISKPVKAGQEILISYEYEAVVSLLWKFPQLLKRIPPTEIANEAFLLSPALKWPVVIDFLNTL